MSGIAKSCIRGPWTLYDDRTRRRRQADLEHHGGAQKALLSYPFDHYEIWRRDMGAHPLFEAPGAFGENQRLIGVLYKHVDDAEAFEAMADMPELAEDSRVIARRRLAMRRTEDWTNRLNGPAASP
jgi:MOSC domain-containing protein YiiM